MDGVSLKEYLGIIVDMEKNIFLQNMIIRQLETDCARLGKETKFLEPSLPQKRSQPKRPLPPSPPSGEVEKLTTRNVCICIAIVWIASLASFNLGFILLWLIGDIIYSLLFGAITAIVTRYIYREKDNREKKKYNLELNTYEQALKEYQMNCKQIEQEYQAATCAYQNKLREYKDNVAKDQQRVALENTKKEILLEELSKAKCQNEASKNVLKYIYDKNIIFPKYRNLVMVSSLYEYICSGRCNTLEGHEGAYNILELEIRLDKIIIQLDRIISMLERISQNQYVVYTAIQEANQQSAKILESTYQMVDRLQDIQLSNQRLVGAVQSSTQATEKQTATIVQQIKTIQQSSAFTAYQGEQTQKELHYMNRMNYLSGKYDEIFFNQPPL